MKWCGFFLALASLTLGIAGCDVVTCRLCFLCGIVLYIIGWIEEKSRYE